ncbi:GntR family transcriptional regulator [Tessaracoccus antarcticus]|uniref:GntR family transcriptional regulator n=1 Tax=Tessaracoccus antarcticus TaxID=2479848 RepID=A0A3M0GI38_9ACTN|nr:GntR family transcriptional regulator [Tessaracoccus antarcticus]RMB62332.1 GntR family transcriptional regulator [Tessaracoccus antarcticus]
MFDDGSPIFQQLADQICGDILRGAHSEGEKVPSINELAVFYRINPATANRAVAQLVDRGVLVKQRGIGMFVAEGARQLVAAERRAKLVEKHIAPLVAEATALGIDTEGIVALIRKESS